MEGCLRKGDTVVVDIGQRVDREKRRMGSDMKTRYIGRKWDYFAIVVVVFFLKSGGSNQ